MRDQPTANGPVAFSPTFEDETARLQRRRGALHNLRWHSSGGRSLYLSLRWYEPVEPFGSDLGGQVNVLDEDVAVTRSPLCLQRTDIAW